MCCFWEPHNITSCMLLLGHIAYKKIHTGTIWNGDEHYFLPPHPLLPSPFFPPHPHPPPQRQVSFVIIVYLYYNNRKFLPPGQIFFKQKRSCRYSPSKLLLWKPTTKDVYIRGCIIHPSKFTTIVLVVAPVNED